MQAFKVVECMHNSIGMVWKPIISLRGYFLHLLVFSLCTAPDRTNFLLVLHSILTVLQSCIMWLYLGIYFWQSFVSRQIIVSYSSSHVLFLTGDKNWYYSTSLISITNTCKICTTNICSHRSILEIHDLTKLYNVCIRNLIPYFYATPYFHASYITTTV